MSGAIELRLLIEREFEDAGQLRRKDTAMADDIEIQFRGGNPEKVAFWQDDN